MARSLSTRDKERLAEALGLAERGHAAEIKLHIEHRRHGEPAMERAAEVFLELGMHQTRGATGLLLYVGLRDRQVAVYTDRGIVERIEQARWQAVTDVVSRAYKEDKPVEGLLEGIARIGAILREVIPGADQAGDELTNTINIDEQE